MMRILAISTLISLAMANPASAQMQILPEKRGAAPEKRPDPEFSLVPLSKKLRICLDRQALIVAPKPVDLETASVAVMARCNAELIQLRRFITTGLPNFSPGPDYWEKEIEPVYMKEARKAVALARTRDLPAPPALPKPKPMAPNNKDQI